MSVGFWTWVRSILSNDRGFLVRDGHELHWPHLPVTVVVMPDAWDAAYGVVRRACDAFNAAIGRDAFVGPDEAIPSMVDAFASLRPMLRNVVLVGLADIDDSHGHTDHRFDSRSGAIWSALVTLPRNMGERAYPVTLHEFGHVLGLDHDDSQRSIMYPQTSARGQVVTQSDNGRLKAVYGRGQSW